MVQGTGRNRVYRGGFEISAWGQSVSLESVHAGEYRLAGRRQIRVPEVLGCTKKEDASSWQCPLLPPTRAYHPKGEEEGQVWAGFLGS